MCLPGQPPAQPATAADAVAMACAGLGWLAAADAAALTTAELADTLRALEQAASLLTAARSRVLCAFHARGGGEDDGHGSGIWRTWPGWPRRSASAPPGPTPAMMTGSTTGACAWARPSAAPGRCAGT